MSGERNEELYNRLGRKRISSRQVDELIGLARGVCADGILNQAEVEFFEKWLAANVGVTDNPVTATLYRRVADILEDGIADTDECQELLDTLRAFSDTTFELGEVLKSTTLPLCSPAPDLQFGGMSYCFTGTFKFGERRKCEAAVEAVGAKAASLTRKTNYLVVGYYATESWKHSNAGLKIMKACEMRDSGVPISIVSEDHWASHL
jgi:NAD-dependent DNA ligase